ncbi:phage terminase large subunit [Caldisericum sp.]|uniref:phage terminase large subunit n=1 Tax=Caldisericum sp. TaxID=2499687 RepID=UPI003D10DA7A
MSNKIDITEFFKPHPKQAEVINYIGKGYNIFYGGAKGGGKTDLSIFVAILSVLQFNDLKVCIIRQSFPELEAEIIDRVFKTYPEHIFEYKYNDRKKIMRFPNGSQIHFRAIQTTRDVKKIQGVEYQLIIIDEAPNFEIEAIHRIETSLRTSKHPNFIPTLLMTGNPLGRSDYYFLTRFVEPDYTDWASYELENKDKYVFVPANVYDNPYIGEPYIKRLKSLPKYIQDAYLLGKWGIGEGRFFEKWNPDIHVIDEFEIPEHWTRKSGIDIGWSNKHPTVCLWLAQDPETLNVYVYREYVKVGTTIEYARDIAELEAGEGYIETFADPSMFFKSNSKGRIGESDAAIFLRETNKFLIPAINDRVLGWRIVKQWLDWGDTTTSKLFVFRNCSYLIKTIPQQRYAKGKREDLDTDGPDDAVDALRYVLLSGFTYPTQDLFYESPKIFDENMFKLQTGFERNEELYEKIDIFYNKALY